MSTPIGFKRADNDGKIRVQIFYQRVFPGSSIDERYIDIVKRGDDRTSDPENTPCSFLTGLIIDPKEYRLRIVNTDHLMKSGYLVCDESQDHSGGNYSQIHLLKINPNCQDLDLPTKVGYVLERVIHSGPSESVISTEKEPENSRQSNYTSAPKKTVVTNSRWA